VANPQASLVVPPADIAAHWRIPLEEPFEAIRAATNLVRRVGAYVVRAEHRSVASVRWEHELVAFLAEEVPEVVAPIPASDGSTFLERDGQVVSLFPYVEGEHIERTDESVRSELPNVLGRIHARASAWSERKQRPGQPSFRTLDWESNLWWDRSLVDRTPLLDDAFDRTVAWVANAPDLRICAIHGDFNPGNVLAREGKVVAVIDWSFSRLDWAAADLACMTGLLAVQADGSLDERIVDEAVTPYADAGGPGEPDVLVPLLRLFFLDVALFALTRKARGESWNPGIVALMERALEHLG
jgi:Ser/Thr protein kinase RdoA (MazF antagonist)